MPALLVSNIAAKTGIPIAEAERRWAKAKAITNDEKDLNPSDGDIYWRYVTGVFKKAMGISDDGAVLESIDSEAHKAATSPKNDLPEPTPAQIESGNYKKGHISIQGLEIAIENPKGSKRRGVSREGKAWESVLYHHYGYLKGTVGADKDHIDVFVGDKTESPHVYVVNQVDPVSGDFDEHKVLLGFDQRDDAENAYLSNYEKGWKGMGFITMLSMVDFKNWLKTGNTKMVLESLFTIDQLGKRAQFESSESFVAEYNGWKITVAKYPHGWSGNAENGNERLGIRGWLKTRNAAVDEFKRMVDNRCGNDEIIAESGEDLWTGVDLDGTLAYYDGWEGEEHIGKPILLMVDKVKEIIQSGETVKIFTARAETENGKWHVQKWLEDNGLGGLEVTNIKDSCMLRLLDDRASRVIQNTGIVVESIYPSQEAANRADIRKFLEGLDAKKIRALKFTSKYAYLSVLKSIVRKLFPEGAQLQFRKDGRVIDYDHFLKDSGRSKYIHTLPETLKREDIKIELSGDDAIKEYFIKKYFDTDIQKDVWDIVVINMGEIRTKIARTGRKGEGYVESLIIKGGAGNEASRSASPEGVTEDASTLPEYDLNINTSGAGVNNFLIFESIVKPDQKPTVSQDQSRKAMKFTLDTQKNTMEGAHRPDVGWIAFLWGITGTAPLFADGDGLARIISKQDFEKKYLSGAVSGRDLCMRLVDIVTRGYIKRKYGPTSRPKIDFSWQGEVATVSWEPARRTWYPSAWREDWGGILESSGSVPGKQPWEMTKAEYLNDFDKKNINVRKTKPNAIGKAYTATMKAEGVFATGDTREDAIKKFLERKHRTDVDQAISEGKPVTADVIKDYPEFLPTPEKQPCEMTKDEIIQSSLRLSYDEFGDQAVSRLNHQRVSSGKPVMKNTDELSLRVQATIASRARFTEPIMAAGTFQDIADVFGDVFGVTLDDEPVMESAQVRTPVTLEENIQRGTEAMNRVISRHVNEPRAMYRQDLGWIAFYWGKTGGHPPKFNGGSGVSHIIAKRDWEGEHVKELLGQKGKDVAMGIVHVIASGNSILRGKQSEISAGGVVALLRLEKDGKEKTWLLTGFVSTDKYTILESSGDLAKFTDYTRPTHNRPTHTRPDMGAEDPTFDKRVNPTEGNVNNIFEGIEGGMNRDWRGKIQTSATFDDIYIAFREAGLLNWKLPDNPEYARKVFDTLDWLRPVLGEFKASGSAVARLEISNKIMKKMGDVGDYIAATVRNMDTNGYGEIPGMQQLISEAGKEIFGDAKAKGAGIIGEWTASPEYDQIRIQIEGNQKAIATVTADQRLIEAEYYASVKKIEDSSGYSDAIKQSTSEMEALSAKRAELQRKFNGLRQRSEEWVETLSQLDAVRDELAAASNKWQPILLELTEKVYGSDEYTAANEKLYKLSSIHWDHIGGKSKAIKALQGQICGNLIKKILEVSPITEEQSTQWASEQVFDKSALTTLKKQGYLEADIRKDMAELFRLSGGRFGKCHILPRIKGQSRACAETDTKDIHVGAEFTKRTLWHEMGHLFEGDPKYVAVANAFLDGRVDKTKGLQRLSKLTGNKNYRRNEVAYTDHLFNPYVGKYYQGRVTEVFSMGVQQFSSPELMDELERNDPEMFRMIVGILATPPSEAEKKIFGKETVLAKAKAEITGHIDGFYKMLDKKIKKNPLFYEPFAIFDTYWNISGKSKRGMVYTMVSKEHDENGRAMFVFSTRSKALTLQLTYLYLALKQSAMPGATEDFMRWGQYNVINKDSIPTTVLPSWITDGIPDIKAE